MKKSYFILILIVSLLAGIFLSASNLPENNELLSDTTKNIAWYSNAINKLIVEEYNIKYNNYYDCYQSPNRANNLRFSYYDNGFSAERRDNSNDWNIDIRLIGDNTGNSCSYSISDISLYENELKVFTTNIEINFINTSDGMRQNFIIHDLDTHPDELILDFAINSNGDFQLSNDEIIFLYKDTVMMEYKDLHVYDNSGRILSSCFEKTQNGFRIKVDAMNAVYPIVIDPISTTPDWTKNFSVNESYFGTSVSGAGDINGDGYSDVIISAERYDNTVYNAGAVWVYYGSSSGLNTTSSWSYKGTQENAYLGHSVNTAGDVNGDGYNDIIFGLDKYSNGESYEGAAYLFYGSSLGLSAVPDWECESNQASAYYGNSVSTAGDVNGDGYSDIIIGAYQYTNGFYHEGAAFLYYGSASGPSAVPDWQCESNQAGASYGYSVSTAGDVNGDGYSDVIIGATGYDNGESNEGAAFVYFGSDTGLSATPDWISESNEIGSTFGSSVNTAGDVNADGYSDVIIGATGYSNGEYYEGAAFVYLGSDTGISITPDWTIEGNQEYGYLGNSVSTAGDVNGDGYSDVIVGEYKYDYSNTDAGAAFLYYGSETGLMTSAAWTDKGNSEDELYGNSVSTAGDVNGDGFSDIIVGAPTESGFFVPNRGSAYVYYGSASGVTSSPMWMGESNQGSSEYGSKSSTAGDVNGDGYTDIIVGAYLYDNVEISEGRAFVYYGSASGFSSTADWTGESNLRNAQYGYSVSTAGDVNGDGYSDIIVGAPGYDNGETYEGMAFVYYGSSSGLSTTPAWSCESNQDNARYGGSVSTAGDVNADGYSDIIVGAWGYDHGQSDEGTAFVYYGSSSGLSLTADWMGESNKTSARYGTSVSTAGDVNGDGFSDILIGAPIFSNGESYEGAAFLYYGSASGPSSSYDWMGESNQASANFGNSVNTAGDVNGDGYSDVIIGAENFDDFYEDEGSAFIYYGSASGLSTEYDWTQSGSWTDDNYGHSVSTAGDMNGDGYSDVIVGAWTGAITLSRQGKAYIYYGSASGISTISSWYKSGDHEYDYFGSSVSTAGDINGDGFSDMIVGARGYDHGESGEGAVFAYFGGNEGLLALPMQIRSDESAPIVAPLYSNYDSSFKISLFARSFLQREKVKLQWEAKPLGTPFDGTGLSESAYWLDTGTDGIERVEKVSGLSNNTYYKWRVRVKYNMAKGTSQGYSRWYYISDNASTEADLKTGSTVMINEININSMIVNDGIYLSVMGNGDRYVINKEETGKYISLGDMKNNEYTDKNPIEGMNEYRIDEYSNGRITNKAEITVFYTSQRKTNMEGFYTNIERLNREIKEQGLYIYDINGRKINKIKNPGAYYIIREIDNQITNTEKVIIIQ